MRLFFALWPDPPAAQELGALSQSLARLAGGKPVPAAKIHLTVAFLGDVDEAALDRAKQAPEGIAHRSFEVALDQVGSFRGARVAWAGCREPARVLMDLNAALAARLAGLGIVLEERSYTPHVTLARKITRAVARTAAEPIRWQAKSLALVRSELGRGSYTTLGEWVLR